MTDLDLHRLQIGQPGLEDDDQDDTPPVRGVAIACVLAAAFWAWLAWVLS